MSAADEVRQFFAAAGSPMACLGSLRITPRYSGQRIDPVIQKRTFARLQSATVPVSPFTSA